VQNFFQLKPVHGLKTNYFKTCNACLGWVLHGTKVEDQNS